MRKYRRRRLTAEEQLMMDLFRGYDTDARAVIDTTTTVTVQVQFLLLRVQRLVSLSSYMSLFVVHHTLVSSHALYL